MIFYGARAEPEMAENFCDSCGRDIGKHDGALCGGCADDATDRFLDRHDDIGPDDL